MNNQETETTELERPPFIPLDSLKRVNDALNFCQSVEVVTIATNDQYLNSTKLFRELGGYIKVVDAERAVVKEPYLTKGREIDSWFKVPLAALQNLKNRLDPAIRTYERAQEQKRIEEQNRLNRIAEEQRKKAEDAARAEREKGEEKRREADRIAKEDASRAAELRRQAEAADARAAQKEEKAATVMAPVAQTALPKAEGVSKRANWKFVVKNQEECIKYCIEKGWYHLLMVNPVTANAHAKSLRQAMSLPGFEIVNDESLTGKSF